MRRLLITSAALLLAAPLLPAQAAGPASNAPAASTANDHVLRIGVVHMTQLTRNMQEEKKLQAELRDRMQKLQGDQQKRAEELNRLTAQLREQLKPGSAQWVDLRNTIDQKKLEMDNAQKMGQLQVDRFIKSALRETYEHISEASATVAQQQHLDLVIADSSPEIIGPDLDSIPSQELNQLLSARAVLFADKKADITEDVLTLLDANFAKQNSGGVTSTGNK